VLGVDFFRNKDAAHVWLINSMFARSIALAWYSRSTLAAQAVVPWTFRVVFAHPTEAKTSGAVLVHVKSLGIPSGLDPFSLRSFCSAGAQHPSSLPCHPRSHSRRRQRPCDVAESVCQFRPRFSGVAKVSAMGLLLLLAGFIQIFAFHEFP
jgi:hypothetical protein